MTAYNPNHDIREGDTVYALRLMGRSASCEWPPAFFCRRGEELKVLEVQPPTVYSKCWYYLVKTIRGSGPFLTSFNDITKMKHFEFNQSEYDKEYENDIIRSRYL